MSYQISAAVREKKGAKIRKNGDTPAVVYGAGQGTQSLSVNYIEFTKLYKTVSESSLIDLVIGGKNAGKVLLQEVQFDPVTDRITHVDFRRVDMTKPITAMVELEFVGEAPVIKALGGTLVRTIQEVKMNCLPSDLVDHITVDVSVLNTFDDMIRVKDLNIPANATIVSPKAEEIVAKAIPALTEEEIKAMEEAGKSADVSKIESAKKKEEPEAEEAGAEAGKEAKETKESK